MATEVEEGAGEMKEEEEEEEEEEELSEGSELEELEGVPKEVREEVRLFDGILRFETGEGGGKEDSCVSNGRPLMKPTAT